MHNNRIKHVIASITKLQGRKELYDLLKSISYTVAIKPITNERKTTIIMQMARENFTYCVSKLTFREVA